MMVKVKLPKDYEGNIDQHPEEQLSYIEEGKVEFQIGNEKKIIRKGDVVYIPSNIKHRVKVVEECVLIDVFSPIRKDLL